MINLASFEAPAELTIITGSVLEYKIKYCNVIITMHTVILWTDHNQSGNISLPAWAVSLISVVWCDATNTNTGTQISKQILQTTEWSHYCVECGTAGCLSLSINWLETKDSY